jgi:NitT/TauT family transport system permease protein
MADADAILVARPEFHRDLLDSAAFGVVEQPLSTFERLYNLAWLRKTVILMLLALAWEIGARLLHNELLLPSFLQTLKALAAGIGSGELLIKTWTSLKVLLMGYSLGIILAALLTAFGIFSRVGTDFLETLTAMFNPLPAIALLPIALIWFGLGNGSLVFVLVHSVVWAVALNTHSGFLAVSNTQRMVGRNCGLSGIGYVTRILIPAAFPSIITGLKIGWAFAWRTLIASELVFGVSSGSGGLGWYIYENKNALEISNVFAGLLTVIVIGLVVENLIFRVIEQRTVRRWGMQS